MTDNTQIASETPEVLYRSLFEALPGSCILLKNNSPLFTILASTPEYLQQTGSTKEGIVGKGIFEAFPGNPDDPTDTGTKDLRASLEQVLLQKKPHHLPTQRYDVAGDNGTFSERYWRAVNKPVFAPGGDVAYIIHNAEDITVMVKTAEVEKHMKDLEESEQDLRSLVLHAPIGICVMDAATMVIKIVNKSFIEIAGRPIDEIVGRTYWDTFSEARPYYEEALNRVIQHGVTIRANEVDVQLLRHAKKEIVNVTFVYQPVKDSNGIVKKVVVWMVDNTLQVTARRKVEESEAKFRTMAESTPVLIAVGDEKGDVTYYNKAWTTLTGRTTEELLRSGWADLISTEDRERFVAIFLDAFAIKGPFTGEFRVKNVHGKSHWLWADGVPRFDTGGNFLGYIAACTDITEHKISQHQLETALEQVRLSKEAAELGTFDLDLEKGSMHWDDRCRTLFGISHHNTVTYEKDFVEGLHPDDRARITKLIDRLLIKSISNGDYDVEYRTVGVEDGLVRWVRAKGKVYFNSEEKPIRFIGSVLDITEKVTALQKIEGLVEERTAELAQANNTLQAINKELQQSNQSLKELAQASKESNLLLQQTNEELEQFAYVTSHDLQEPLRKIRFYSKYVLDSVELAEANKNYINRINASAQRMSGLIQSLLDYSRISQKMHFAPVNLNAIVAEVINDFELLIQQKQANIRIEELPVIEAVSLQMNQLFFNLIGNALKFTRRNLVPIIHVSSLKLSDERKKEFSELDPAQEYVEVQITDNGIGFNEEYATRIFTIFQRLNESSIYGGYGIGLALCKKIIANHSGRIYAKSKAGEGASFIFILPSTQTRPPLN